MITVLSGHDISIRIWDVISEEKSCLADLASHRKVVQTSQTPGIVIFYFFTNTGYKTIYMLNNLVSDLFS